MNASTDDPYRSAQQLVPQAAPSYRPATSTDYKDVSESTLAPPGPDYRARSLSSGNLMPTLNVANIQYSRRVSTSAVPAGSGMVVNPSESISPVRMSPGQGVQPPTTMSQQPPPPRGPRSPNTMLFTPNGVPPHNGRPRSSSHSQVPAGGSATTPNTPAGNAHAGFNHSKNGSFATTFPLTPASSNTSLASFAAPANDYRTSSHQHQQQQQQLPLSVNIPSTLPNSVMNTPITSSMHSSASSSACNSSSATPNLSLNQQMYINQQQQQQQQPIMATPSMMSSPRSPPSVSQSSSQSSRRISREAFDHLPVYGPNGSIERIDHKILANQELQDSQVRAARLASEVGNGYPIQNQQQQQQQQMGATRDYRTNSEGSAHGMGYPPESPPTPPPKDALLLKWFNSVDTDNSGLLDVSELQHALVNGDWSHFSLDAIKLMLQMFDSEDHCGFVDFEGFKSLCKYLDSWKSIFDKFEDTKVKGVIRSPELAKALHAFGYPVSEFTITALMTRFGKPIDEIRGNVSDQVHHNHSKDHNHGLNQDCVGITFDGFISSCVTVKQLSDAFRAKDTGNTGQVAFSHDEFVYTVVSNAL